MSESTETAATTTATTTSAEPDVMSLAAQADAGTLPETTSTPPAQETGTPAEQGSAEHTDDKAKAIQQKATQQTPEQKPAKPESNYTKSQKEQARLADNWKKFDAEKAAFRKEREAWEAERRVEAAKQTKPESKSQAKAEDYEELAKTYEEEGNTTLANAARQRAKEIRDAEKAEATQTAERPNGNPFEQPQFKQQWDKNVQDLVTAEPELANPQNPVVQIANKLCADPQYQRFFTAHPEGIKAAVEVAKLIRDVQQVKPLQTQLAELQKKHTAAQAEVERLTKLTSLSGSSPTSKSAPKALADMSSAEADKTVRELAAAADRGEI